MCSTHHVTSADEQHDKTAILLGFRLHLVLCVCMTCLWTPYIVQFTDKLVYLENKSYLCNNLLIFDIHMSVHCNIITNYNQQDATFLEFIYFYRRSTCFRRFLRPSSGAHNCTYSFTYCQPILLLAISSTVAASSSTSWQYLKLYVQFCAPDDGRRNRLKHVERL